MPSDFHHGPRVIEIDNDYGYITTYETSVIGMVVTAPDADPIMFPLNKPVMLIGASQYLDKCGVRGTLAKALDGIKDQYEPLIHVVRVAEGDTEAETISNIIGTKVNGVFTGLQALLACQQMFGEKPRILGVPEWDKKQPIAHELGIIAEKLRAFCYVAVDANALEDAYQYRENFGSKRTMLIYPEFIGWDVNSNAEIALSASTRALGLRAKIDNEIGWHKSISNMPINGVDGLSKHISSDYTSTLSDLDYLNRNQITTLLRKDGFRIWGNRTCSIVPGEQFECYVRTADVLADTMAMNHLYAIDKPISRHLVENIVDTINMKLQEWVTREWLIGGKAFMPVGWNTKATLGNGKLFIEYDYTPVPPLEDLQLLQKQTSSFLIPFIDDLISATKS